MIKNKKGAVAKVSPEKRRKSRDKSTENPCKYLGFVV
jgi:hypothetical protein